MVCWWEPDCRRGLFSHFPVPHGARPLARESCKRQQNDTIHWTEDAGQSIFEEICKMLASIQN